MVESICSEFFMVISCICSKFWHTKYRKQGITDILQFTALSHFSKICIFISSILWTLKENVITEQKDKKRKSFLQNHTKKAHNFNRGSSQNVMNKKKKETLL